MNWFAFTWNIDPDQSRLNGPFATKEDAIAWIDDQEDVEQAGVVQLPSFEIVKQS